jgi:hypothetical protein
LDAAPALEQQQCQKLHFAASLSTPAAMLNKLLMLLSVAICGV